jgi:hypothetical protein
MPSTDRRVKLKAKDINGSDGPAASCVCEWIWLAGRLRDGCVCQWVNGRAVLLVAVTHHISVRNVMCLFSRSGPATVYLLVTVERLLTELNLCHGMTVK